MVSFIELLFTLLGLNIAVYFKYSNMESLLGNIFLLVFYYLLIKQSRLLFNHDMLC